MGLSISQVFAYFSVSADFDISADPVKFALDPATLTAGGGVTGTYIPPGSLPPSAAARHTAGLYWWRVQVGPTWATAALPLVVGDNTVYCIVDDNPEAPAIHYTLTVTD